MTLTFQLRSSRFHPAWLLPPLVPLGQWFIDGPGDSSSLMIRLILTLGIPAFALFLAREDRSARDNRWSKELRLLMPPAVGTLVIPAALHNDLSELAVVLHCLGSIWMGATVFGAEVEHRTLGPLLAQPISRRRIFWEKNGILAALCLAAWVNTTASLEKVQGSTDWVILLAAPALAVCTGPLFSLLGRSTLAGMVFTATAPMLFLLGSMMVSASIQSGMPVLSAPPTAEQLKAIEPYNRALALWGDFQPWLRGLYLAAGPLLGWLWFRSLSWQDGAAVARPPSGSARSRVFLGRLVRMFVPGNSATAHLMRKEIRLHAIPWMIAALTTGLWVLWMIARGMAPQGDLKDSLNEFSPVSVICGMLGVVALVTAGAGSVAEERALGTLDWQVTQPVTGRRQWWIKSLVAVVTGLVTGLLIPATLLALGFGPERWEKEGLVFEQLPTMAFATGAGLALSLSLYASSVSRNTMRAVGLTVLLGAAAVALVFAVAAPGLYWAGEKASEMSRAFDGGASFDGPGWDGEKLEKWVSGSAMQSWMLLTVLAGCFLAIIHWAWQACANFSRSSMPSHVLRRQWFHLSLGLIVLTLVGVAVIGSLSLARQAAQLASIERSGNWNLRQSLTRLAVDGSLPPPVAEWLQVRPGTVDDTVQVLVQRDGRRQAGKLGYRLSSDIYWIESRLKMSRGAPVAEEIRGAVGVEATTPANAALELVRRLGPTRAREMVSQLPEIRARLSDPKPKPGVMPLSPELRRRYNLPDPPRP